jgi:CTP:molybdopterin cytidylyltransferase MocA
MGYPKALLPLGSDTFLTRILQTLKAIGMPKPVIVLGRTASVIQTRLQNWPADIYINHAPDRGQLSSIQIGLSHIDPEFIAGMIWPVDQPAVSENLVRCLVELFLNSSSRIACPVYGDKRGHPAIFHRALFREFMEAPLEEGPKKIIVRHQAATALLPTEESASVRDIDTPAEYEALTGESLDNALAKIKFPI